MRRYETPKLVELGSVADFTRADGIGFKHDNQAWLADWGINYGWSAGPSS